MRLPAKSPIKSRQRPHYHGLRQKDLRHANYLLDSILSGRPIGLTGRNAGGTCGRSPPPPNRSSCQRDAAPHGESDHDAAGLVQTGVQADPGRHCRGWHIVGPACDDPDAIACTTACHRGTGTGCLIGVAANFELLAAAAIDAVHRTVATGDFGWNAADSGT